MVLIILAVQEKRALASEALDYLFTGEYKGFREFHLAGNILTMPNI